MRNSHDIPNSIRVLCSRRQARIEAFKQGSDEPAREFARRKSMDFVLEAQTSNFKNRFVRAWAFVVGLFSVYVGACCACVRV